MLTTHDMDEAVSLADEVGIVKSGRLVASGSTQEFTRSHGYAVEVSADSVIPEEAAGRLAEAGYALRCTDSGTLSGTLDSASAADLGALSAELDRVGLGAASIEVRSTSLRDAFLEVTQ